MPGAGAVGSERLNVRSNALTPKNQTFTFRSRSPGMIYPASMKGARRMNQEMSTVPYQSYVLRLWNESARNGDAQWRFILVDSQTGQRLGFESLTALFEHLSSVTESGSMSAADLG